MSAGGQLPGQKQHTSKSEERTLKSQGNQRAAATKSVRQKTATNKKNQNMPISSFKTNMEAGIQHSKSSMLASLTS